MICYSRPSLLVQSHLLLSLIIWGEPLHKVNAPLDSEQKQSLQFERDALLPRGTSGYFRVCPRSSCCFVAAGPLLGDDRCVAAGGHLGVVVEGRGIPTDLRGARGAKRRAEGDNRDLVIVLCSILSFLVYSHHGFALGSCRCCCRCWFGLIESPRVPSDLGFLLFLLWRCGVF